MARTKVPRPTAQKPRRLTKEIAAKREAQGKKNKLSATNLTFLTLTVKRGRSTGKRHTYRSLANAINDTKTGTDTVSRRTIGNHAMEAKLVCSSKRGNWPAQISFEDLPTWLRRRRGFCKVYKSIDKSNMIMADETFFGLERRTCMHKPSIHPEGSKQGKAYKPQAAKDRICVWAALGPTNVAPLVIGEDGQFFNSDTYEAALTPQALPYLSHVCRKGEYWEDGARFHTSRKTRSVFQVYDITQNFTKGYWKDLNWMEKVWANIKDLVYYDGKTYLDKAELIAAVRTAWKTLSQDKKYRQDLIHRFENACRKCLASGGYYINW